MASFSISYLPAAGARIVFSRDMNVKSCVATAASQRVATEKKIVLSPPSLLTLFTPYELSTLSRSFPTDDEG